jgi:hypothetical protein
MNDEDNKKEDTTGSTKRTWKTISTIPTYKVDVDQLGTLPFKDKVYYLTIRGWKIEIETRGSHEYIYAVKYFERKKRRIYLGKSEDRPDIEKTRSTPHSTIENLLREMIVLNFEDRIFYLAIRGWRIEIEIHDNEEFIYAFNYIDKEKKRIRLGKKEDRPGLEKVDLK